MGALLLVLLGCEVRDTPETKSWEPAKALVSAEVLDSLLRTGEPHLRIIEVSKARDYLAGHLPGAVNLWRPDYESQGEYPYEGMMASREAMEKLLGKLGVLPEDRLVLYDQKGCADASRLRWILRQYGHPKVFLLDGEEYRWKQLGFSLDTSTVAMTESSNYRFPESPRLSSAHFGDILLALADTNHLLLDVRENYEFGGLPFRSGEKIHHFKAGASDAGSIPGAIHLNWSDAVDLAGDHRFKSPEDLRQLYEGVGVRPDKDIIVYCQSGVRSANTTFVLAELLGYPRVRNYDGSWIEWSYYGKHGFHFPIERHSDSTAVALAYRALSEQ
ncbi:sulfurtransferase [Lewinella sp. W8]|uniref:sulfurtransferase n=1 Tax=Lewinella sp. W8 TaxID=2528208 RepID=UPI001565D821|nr:sulfurtransferase [Lewinella sp. W8]